MKQKETSVKIALVGNPNIGKTTLFNKLCGLNQKTGNYPGVTVDKKKGILKHGSQYAEVIDLPGINSLFPNSKDEELVLKYLMETDKDEFPDKIILVASAINLKRNLYLFDQIRDLNIPLILVVNMVDLAQKRGVFIDFDKLSSELGVTVIPLSAKKSQGLEELKNQIFKPNKFETRPIHFIQPENLPLLKDYSNIIHSQNEYLSFLNLTQALRKVDSTNPIAEEFVKTNEINIRQWKTNASILRYKFINQVLANCLNVDKAKAVDLTSKLDRVLVHPIFGYVIFILILFGIFQSIFWLASYPMDWIDAGFSLLSGMIESSLPEGYFTRLITEGIIPGLGGVVIFVPQIAILFFLFSILEESGYMSRIVYLTDTLMQKFGMSGKSIVPMISGLACAIPAIMAARSIENTRERLITILVTPLLTCSARIPVYVVLIALIIPDDAKLWIFNAQGIALMGLYLLGVLMTFIVAFVLKLFLKADFKSYLLLEMPEYLLPDIKNVLITVWTNVKSFLWNAGKIIIATSIILFVLATNGGKEYDNSAVFVSENYPDLTLEEAEKFTNAHKIENSYLGKLGKSIEPVIQPLGYDWKIGIAIISSLAAREVFVGTISIIYAIDSDEEMTIRDRLRNEVNLTTGKPAFGFATSISLLLFYAFSLQCMSTVAVTYKETKSFKWTAIQFSYMTVLAYLAALIAFQVLK